MLPMPDRITSLCSMGCQRATGKALHTSCSRLSSERPRSVCSSSGASPAAAAKSNRVMPNARLQRSPRFKTSTAQNITRMIGHNLQVGNVSER